ncbi:hypothetical protein GCM10020258_02210 [Sphingomonas yabuuchiae]
MDPRDARGRAGGDIALTWHVAPMGGSDAVGLHTGRVTARAARDFTAKVEVAGLQPGRDYRYWFETAGAAFARRAFPHPAARAGRGTGAGGGIVPALSRRPVQRL